MTAIPFVSKACTPAWVALMFAMCPGCGEEDHAREFMPAPESEMVYEVKFENPFSSTDTTTQNGSNPCDPRGMLGYETASPLARHIADDSGWNIYKDETAALALIDSFAHSPHRAFYSAILLRTMPKADGAFAEPLGLVIHDDLLEQPSSLLACCWENGCDGHEGLLLWTYAIAGELLIEHEEDPWSAFVEYSKMVEAKARTECDLQTSSRAHEFLYEIGRHLKQAIERDSLDGRR